MKEIDFIPEWYKSGRKRRVSYHRQYMMIGCLVVALLAWSYSAGSFLSAAKGAVEGARSLLQANEPLGREYAALKDEIKVLTERAEILDRIRTRTPLEAILGELSCLVSDRIVLSSLEFVSEPLRPEAARTKNAVVIARRQEEENAALPASNNCTRIVLAGIAADASDAAALIAAMEKSIYFCRIIPGYSRNKDVRGYRATEFQITAHVADYLMTNEAALK
jgi:hypothetical protein